jgi:septal ring factor EnvC (AmiA/AmiB activator)
VSLLASVEALLRLLQQRDAHGCLVGGLAVSVRCDPRFTLDADIAVAVSNDSEAQAHVRFLVQAGYVVTATAEQTADLRHLAAEADAEEWQRAQVAAQLIMDRGYGRGRDLTADLAALRTCE